MTQPVVKPPKNTEIAARIAAHLERFAAEDLKPRKTFWCPLAWSAGSRVGVKYISYQGDTFLTKTAALSYLEWLDAGNVGRHYEFGRAVPK